MTTPNEVTEETTEEQAVSQEEEQQAPEQVEEWKKEIEGLRSELRGLQSRGDRVTADAAKQAAALLKKDFSSLSKFQQKVEMDAALAQVPEDMRSMMVPLYQQIAELKNQLSTAQQPQQEPQESKPEWRITAEDYAEKYGVNPKDTRIDWSLLKNGEFTSGDFAAWNHHLSRLYTPQPTPKTQSPPVDTGPRTPSGLNSADDIIDAVVRGKLSPQEGNKKHYQVTGAPIPGFKPPVN